MSMKNSNDTIGNQTRDLLVCSEVPQPTAPPAACPQSTKCLNINLRSATQFSIPIILQDTHLLFSKGNTERALYLSPGYQSEERCQNSVLCE
jgi:hypothetical protein